MKILYLNIIYIKIYMIIKLNINFYKYKLNKYIIIIINIFDYNKFNILNYFYLKMVKIVIDILIKKLFLLSYLFHP